MRILLGVAVLVVIAVLFAMGWSYFQERSFSKARDARLLKYYKETYLSKQGWKMGFGDYKLHSFDGGKRWYAVELGEDDAVIIKGLADEVFPGLLDRIDGLDALMAYVKKSGPLTFSGERAKTDQAILEAAGFAVAEK